MTQRHVINASVSPKGSLETLSQREVQQLSEAGTGLTYTLFRQCALAILNTGAHVDNAKTIPGSLQRLRNPHSPARPRRTPGTAERPGRRFRRWRNDRQHP
jgi:hypothetical protein